jgi:hypothetical protein
MTSTPIHPRESAGGRSRPWPAMAAAAAVLLSFLGLDTLRETVAQTSTPSLTINPIADAYVSSNATSSNFGQATTLQSDGSPLQESYLKFDLGPLAGQTVVSASLRMFVTNGSPGVQNVKNVADNTWSEPGLTWANRPPKGTLVASFTPGNSTSVWREVDVTPAVAAKVGAIMSLLVDSTNGDAYHFNSRNAASNGVELIVQASGTAPPTVPPSPSPGPTPSPSSASPYVLTIPASEDTYVDETLPDNNFGLTTDLRSDGTPAQESYMKFELGALAGRVISSARLRMFVNNGSPGVHTSRRPLITTGRKPA